VTPTTENPVGSVVFPATEYDEVLSADSPRKLHHTRKSSFSQVAKGSKTFTASSDNRF